MNFGDDQVHFPSRDSSERLFRGQPFMNYFFPVPLEHAPRSNHYHASLSIPPHTATSFVVSNLHQAAWNDSSSAIHPPLLPFHHQYHDSDYDLSVRDLHVTPTQVIPQLHPSSPHGHDTHSFGRCDQWMKEILACNTESYVPLDCNEFFATLLPLPELVASEADDVRQILIAPLAISNPSNYSVGPFCGARGSSSGNATSVKLEQQSFLCQWVTTNGLLCCEPIAADRRSMVEHLHASHGIQSGNEKARTRCSWMGCTKDLNKESLPRHILSVHLKNKVFCIHCGMHFAREDSLKRHLKGVQHDHDGCPQEDKNDCEPLRTSVQGGMPTDGTID